MPSTSLIVRKGFQRSKKKKEKTKSKVTGVGPPNRDTVLVSTSSSSTLISPAADTHDTISTPNLHPENEKNNAYMILVVTKTFDRLPSAQEQLERTHTYTHTSTPLHGVFLMYDSQAQPLPMGARHESTRGTYRIFNHFSAIAPAATRPIVSRADERPPPLEARTPYFSWYVKSACEGRGASTMFL